MPALDLLLWHWIVPRLTAFPVLFFWDDMLGHYNCPQTGTREMRGLWFRIFSTHGTGFRPDVLRQAPRAPAPVRHR